VYREVIAESVPKRTLRGTEERGAQISQSRNPLFERFGRPHVVAIEADELPVERSDVGEEFVVQRFALGAKLGRAASIGVGASKPLCYWFKGDKSPTKSGPQNGARTLYALPRKPSS
jgi:hypothetical protein